MNLIRFVGIEELENLLEQKQVRPLKPRRDCLYFFPAYDEPVPEYEGRGAENQTIYYRLSYLTGIIEEYHTEILGSIYLCLNLDIPHTRLKPAWEMYADPDGSWFARISCLEYHAENGYDLKNVKSIDVWQDDSFLCFKPVKNFGNIEECIVWLKEVIKT